MAKKKTEKPANLKIDTAEEYVALIAMCMSNGSGAVLDAIAALKTAGKDFAVSDIKQQMEAPAALEPEDDDE